MWPVQQRKFSVLPLGGVVNRVYSPVTALLAGARHFYKVGEMATFIPGKCWFSRQLSTTGFAAAKGFGQPEHGRNGFSILNSARQNQIDHAGQGQQLAGDEFIGFRLRRAGG